jgi:hypothetical protein
VHELYEAFGEVKQGNTLNREMLLVKGTKGPVKKQNEAMATISTLKMSSKKLSDVRGDPNEPEILHKYCKSLTILFLNDNLFTRLIEGSFLGLKRVQ